MAIPKIKATYALDAEAVRALERMARHLRVSKSEALRRAIHVTAERAVGGRDDAVAALDRLQEVAGLSRSAAHRLSRATRVERKEGSAHREKAADLSPSQAPMPRLRRACSTRRDVGADRWLIA